MNQTMLDMDRPGEVVVKEYGGDITNLVSDLHQAKRIQKIQYALHITENEFLKHVVCTWLHLKPIDYIKQRAWYIQWNASPLN